MDYIKVKTANPPLNMTAGLHEKNAAHPGGEAFVNGDIVALVAPTDEVLTRIQTGLLVQTDEPETLPFDGYNGLSVSDVATRLTKEGEIGRIVIRQYEASHKGRKGILAPGAPVVVGDVELIIAADAVGV